jgi:hypothetical protein
MATSKTAISVVACLLFGGVAYASTQQNEPSAGNELYQKVQSEFADAYNRKVSCDGCVF